MSKNTTTEVAEPVVIAPLIVDMMPTVDVEEVIDEDLKIPIDKHEDKITAIEEKIIKL